MKNYLIAGIGGTLAGLLVTTQLAGPLIAQEAATGSGSAESSLYEDLDLFGSVFEQVRRQYVEEVDDKTLIEAAINGMLTSLDPHSGFVAATDYVRAFADQIRAFVPMTYTVLGTDGFGRSDTRANLRRHFEVDGEHIAATAVYALFKEGKVTGAEVEAAYAKCAIDPTKINPRTA